MILVHGEDACFVDDCTLWAPVPAGQRPGSGSVDDQAQEALGLTHEEEALLSNTNWRPAPGLTPADAIDRIADGVPVAAVTDWRRFDATGSTIGRSLRDAAAHA